jgi:hypothetical protein
MFALLAAVGMLGWVTGPPSEPGFAPKRFAKVVSVGEHELALELVKHFLMVYTIESLELDGRRLYPPRCDEADAQVALCSPRHRRMRRIEGNGHNLILHDHVVRGDDVLLVFRATLIGSPLCDTYGVWTMRIDVAGRVFVGEPTSGCFGGEGWIDVGHDPFLVRTKGYDWATFDGRPAPWQWVAVPTIREPIRSISTRRRRSHRRSASPDPDRAARSTDRDGPRSLDRSPAAGTR